MSLYDQIVAVSTSRETKAEIVDYYRETYKGRGQAGWKQHLVHDLASITGMNPKNLERRFDPSRINNPERRNADQYRELGDQLPPMPPEGGYHIEGTVWIKYSEDCEEREIEIEVTGEDAKEFANMAFDHVQAVINVYNKMDIGEEGYSPCAEPSLTVSAIGG